MQFSLIRIVVAACLTMFVGCPAVLWARGIETPLHQESATGTEVQPRLTLRTASRNDRWLGSAPRDVRWAADGSGVYFRWTMAPDSDDVPEADPWFWSDRGGRKAREVEEPDEIRLIPAENIAWSADGENAAWSRGNTLVAWDGIQTRAVVTLNEELRRPRFHAPGIIHFEAGESLYQYALAEGTVALIAARTTPEEDVSTSAGTWRAAEEQALFQHIRHEQARDAVRASVEHALDGSRALLLPAAQRIDNLTLSPDGRYLTFRATTPATDRPPTQYIDYTDASGYAKVHEARSKVGESRDTVRLGVLPMDASIPEASREIQWVTLPEAGDQNTAPYGPWWSPDGSRALLQFIGEDHQDLWIAELNVEQGSAHVITHDHDDAWIGGPPVQANYLQPALLEWLDDGRWVFASERSGWSHLYIADRSGRVTPLTSGEWEVRGAALSRDRRFWLLQGSREHPYDDQLYRMPAAGGAMEKLTRKAGRSEGWLSPDGERLAMIHSTATDLPDLFLGSASGSAFSPVTVSGTAHYRALALAEPEIVSLAHPDGDPIWAALYTPDTAHPARPAVIHVHGGGYRQFAHRGWTVYGWALHMGYLNYLVQEGYTVLDFDYRGGAGFGRDYRTDIARSMGIKDADGVAAAAQWLVSERGIDAGRIGMHGVSYGGFLTLMTLFRHPGSVAAGIARASVSDWAHYSDGWTSRILGVPQEDPEAYRRSSPIYYAEGLQAPLLLTHGILDDNVHFQDSARLIQRLIELEKDFEVMVYPIEPHTIQSEASRYDFVRRATAFFAQHLLGDQP